MNIHDGPWNMGPAITDSSGSQDVPEPSRVSPMPSGASGIDIGLAIGADCGFIGMVIWAAATDEQKSSEEIDNPIERRNNGHLQTDAVNRSRSFERNFSVSGRSDPEREKTFGGWGTGVGEVADDSDAARNGFVERSARSGNGEQLDRCNDSPHLGEGRRRGVLGTIRTIRYGCSCFLFFVTVGDARRRVSGRARGFTEEPQAERARDAHHANNGDPLAQCH